EVLAERIRLRIDSLLVDGLPDRAAGLAPPIHVRVALVGFRDPQEPIQGDPRQHLRADEVPEVATDLPDAAVGLLPLLEDGLTDSAQKLPEDVVDLAAVAPVVPRRIEHLAVDVELELLRRRVADSDRPGAAVPVEVIEHDLGQEALAADAVH